MMRQHISGHGKEVASLRFGAERELETPERTEEGEDVF